MPLIINKKIPAFRALERESVFEITTERAKRQDIRPLEIGILNLMPAATLERTEIQFLRLLANTPLQIRPTFISFDTHKSQSKQKHFDAFYRPISAVKKSGLDGLIITGGNLEGYTFEDVLFWDELAELMDWAHKNITSTIYCCWAAQAKLYREYNIHPQRYRAKKLGVFPHRVHHELRSPFTVGMDDEIFVPHARERGIERKHLGKRFDILVESKEAGPHLFVARRGRDIFVQGHQEYDRSDIAGEYTRDISRGLATDFPKNYFPGDNPHKTPRKNWTANGQVFYSNWINWVYQTTHFDVKKPLMRAT